METKYIALGSKVTFTGEDGIRRVGTVIGRPGRLGDAFGPTYLMAVVGFSCGFTAKAVEPVLRER